MTSEISLKSDANILVIGDVMLDHYIYGDCNRISPEAPVQVVEVAKDTYTLGGAGNVLENLLALGCNATLYALTGNDANAAIVQEQLQGSGAVNYFLPADDNRCTTLKTRVLVSNHQLIRLDREVTNAISDDIANKFLFEISKNIEQFDIVILSDYNKGLLSDFLLASVFDICNRAGKKTIVDPKGVDYTKYKGATLVKPNKKEASVASSIAIKDNASLEAACVKIKEITGCENVIVTMSENGIAISGAQELTIIPTRAIDVIDVTGAGDTVIAAIALALASNYSLHDACEFANKAAAIVVSKVGSATATLTEIKSRFDN